MQIPQSGGFWASFETSSSERGLEVYVIRLCSMLEDFTMCPIFTVSDKKPQKVQCEGSTFVGRFLKKGTSALDAEKAP